MAIDPDYSLDLIDAPLIVPPWMQPPPPATPGGNAQWSLPDGDVFDGNRIVGGNPGYLRVVLRNASDWPSQGLVWLAQPHPDSTPCYLQTNIPHWSGLEFRTEFMLIGGAPLATLVGNKILAQAFIGATTGQPWGDPIVLQSFGP